eukprot:NODE_2579_length_579_cov_147.237736_g2207_i0.p1 GENE.NODE_2579_length_579_cov_147.237736_g2207_i0~~NODE_2579_length_579_cov_147.237736_g2207_i0.p1  ORF type:complete len:163 (-),score=21.50 NODE_2579_length_579_cov_147.237736_g2207_i0:90-557(-)
MGIAEQYPHIVPELEDIIDKKKPLILVKCANHIQLVAQSGKLLFFQERDGPWIPSLRLLHQYPYMLPRMQVDIGGCKFVIGGANIMCPGLTSPGGSMDDVEKGVPVGIGIEGKQEFAAVGVAKMSTSEIREVNKGPCIDNLHYLGDGLWHNPHLE